MRRSPSYKLIREDDSVARVVTASHIDEDGCVKATAFLLRPGEPGLSVNWLEWYGRPASDANLKSILACIRSKPREVKKTHKFAILQVGDIGKIESEGRCLTVVSTPEKNKDGDTVDPSHAEVMGLPPAPDTEMLAAELLAQCVDRLVGVDSLDK